MVKLDAEDCLAMFQTKICSIKDDTATKLVCNGEYCSVTEKPIVPYFKDIWMWGYNQQTLYECKIIPKVISATKKDDNLFGSSCKAKDLKWQVFFL